MKKLISRKQLLKNNMFTVTDNVLLDPAGNRIRRILVEHGGSAVVLPTDGKGRVLLVRQYRFPARDYLWELPAGMVDPGETALQASKRELLEETGYRARKWKKLSTFLSSPGFLEEKMTIYLATDLVAGEASPTEDEHLDVKWFDAEWVENQIRRGRIRDAKTIVGMYFWRCLAAKS